MHSTDNTTGRQHSGSAAVNIRALSTLFFPITVMLLIWVIDTLYHVYIWWLCSAKIGDPVNVWMGSATFPISTYSMFLTISGLTVVFTSLEWWHERTHLGVRDWKRTCTYAMAIAVCASMVVFLVQLKALLAFL